MLPTSIGHVNDDVISRHSPWSVAPLLTEAISYINGLLWIDALITPKHTSEHDGYCYLFQIVSSDVYESALTLGERGERDPQPVTEPAE